MTKRRSPSGRESDNRQRLRPAVLARDNYTCQLCMSPNFHPMDLTVDHIIPAALGGPTEMDNLRTVCRLCHVFQQKQQGIWHNRDPRGHNYRPDGYRAKSH